MYINVSKDSIKLGVISDTHGYFRPEIAKIFSGVDYIIHAGDIGDQEIIQNLERIAPVCAVLGNTDSLYKFPDLNETAYFQTKNSNIIVIHDISRLDLDPLTAGFNCVIYGHSHVPQIENKNNVLYLNPGSAGPKRFKLPISVALLEIHGQKLSPTLFQFGE